jgi:hypothetical protein
MEKQSNKRSKQKKTYREIVMEKQANTGKNGRKKIIIIRGNFTKPP